MLCRSALLAIAVSAAVLGAAAPAAAEVQVTITGGRVTVTAKNATPAQILAEWARVGQTRIVNAERVTGGPMTLELTNVSEVEAIEVLLRSAGGYLLAPRRVDAANLSRYDRILILPPSAPASSAPRVVSAPTPAAPPRPAFMPQPGAIAAQQPPPDDNDQPAERPTVVNPPQNARPPVFTTYPQPTPQRPAQTQPAAPAPTYTVTSPVGVSVPGMVVPTPQPAGQPGATPQQQPQQR